jgi:acyl dehydratase
VIAFSKTFDDAEAVILAGLAQDPNALFLAGRPALLSPVMILATALAALSRAAPAKLPGALEFDVTGELPARGATIAVDISDDIVADSVSFAAHGVRGKIELRGADHADRPLRPVPPVLLAFRKLVTETDILLACGLTGDVHPWHLQDVAAHEAGLAARPLPSVLLLALALGRCDGSAQGRLPRHGKIAIHRAPVLGNDLRFARTGEGARERVAVVLGERVIADAQFEFVGAPS